MEEREIRNLLDSASKWVTDIFWQSQYKELITAPANPYISDLTKELLRHLYRLQGKVMITGQHEYLEAPYNYTESINKQVGAYPAIKGVELGGITLQSVAELHLQRLRVVDACKAWNAAGGIVTASYHAAYPGGKPLWSNVQRTTTQEEFNQIVTPATALNTLLLYDIDRVAYYLKELRDAGVPVLWRPYHEMNGGWFWWGAKSNFTALWDLMFDRFVNHHGLNNLLWVWSPNAKNQWCDPPADYYPGSGKVDILALDIYENDFKQSHYDDLRDIARGKIIAIGENGQLPNPTTLSSNQPDWSYQMTWGKLLTEKNSRETIQGFMENSFTLSREEYNSLLVPIPETAVPSPLVNGLLGKYFIGKKFEKLKVTKVIPLIDFNWKKGTTVGDYMMSIRWIGFVQSRYSEQFTIYTYASDGVRLYIGDMLLIDDWNLHAPEERSAKVDLEAGKYYRIKLEYFNNGDPEAVVKLSWSSSSQVKEVIPRSQLFTEGI